MRDNPPIEYWDEKEAELHHKSMEKRNEPEAVNMKRVKSDIADFALYIYGFSPVNYFGSKYSYSKFKSELERFILEKIFPKNQKEGE